jgi:hypothetical protein
LGEVCIYVCMYVFLFSMYIYTDDLISEVYIQNLFMLYSMFVWQYDAIVIFCVNDRLAWASRKSLSSWFYDLILRKAQLSEWAKSLALPYSIWLPGLINPTALLTAIKQVRRCNDR